MRKPESTKKTLTPGEAPAEQRYAAKVVRREDHKNGKAAQTVDRRVEAPVLGRRQIVDDVIAMGGTNLCLGGGGQALLWHGRGEQSPRIIGFALAALSAVNVASSPAPDMVPPGP